MQPRISWTVLKNLNDADSCPRFGSDLGSKVNAEPKSFPEGSGCTKCYSSLNDYLAKFLKSYVST